MFGLFLFIIDFNVFFFILTFIKKNIIYKTKNNKVVLVTCTTGEFGLLCAKNYMAMYRILNRVEV
jgi:hypothetical protein